MNPASDLDPAFADWHCTAALSTDTHRQVVRHLSLDACKWDTQIGDTCALSPFALVLPKRVWQSLVRLAEGLTRELNSIETEIAERSKLWPLLGLPAKVRRALSHPEPWTPTAARILRYDFHPTVDGWKISEVNSDVPGGLCEASHFTRTMASVLACGANSAGDPSAELCAALATQTVKSRCIALLAAPGYIEDQQVIAFVSDGLRARGIATIFARPEQLVWLDGHASVQLSDDDTRPVDAIYRFFQGEWLTRIPGQNWRLLLRGGLTPVCNPGVAVLSESKRLPLVWPQLDTLLPVWQSLLPPIHSPFAPWVLPARACVLKPAYCNTGDAVISSIWSSRGTRWSAGLSACWHPRRWLVQERFETLSLSTPLGPMRPCLGVYTINGHASGIYARLSSAQVIDYSARDAAVLIAQ